MREVIWLGDSTPVYPIGGADPLLGHRDESWRWDILTLTEAPAGTLDGVKDASLEFNISNTIRGGGNLSWSGTEEPDWSKMLLQPWHILKTPQGEIGWPRGVFIPAAGRASHSDTGKAVGLELYDKLLILDRDKVDATYTVTKGTHVVTAIRILLASAGQDRHAIEDNDGTLRSPMVWPAGTTKLAIVNELLKSINYFSLWCDGYGVYQGRPYQKPSARPVVRTFVDDEDSIVAPDFEHEEDRFNIPNKVILVGRGDGDAEGLVAVATNEDPKSKFSHSSLGWWVVHVETDIEATSQSVIDGLADRRLAELSRTASAVDFEHAHVPLELNDIVEFKRGDRGLNIRAAVQSMTISTATGSLVQTAIREVSV